MQVKLFGDEAVATQHHFHSLYLCVDEEQVAEVAVGFEVAVCGMCREWFVGKSQCVDVGEWQVERHCCVKSLSCHEPIDVEVSDESWVGKVGGCHEVLVFERCDAVCAVEVVCTK